MSLHQKASQAHRRGHMDFHSKQHTNPYPAGTFKAYDWDAGHADAANSMYWSLNFSARQRGEQFQDRKSWLKENAE